MTRSLMILTLVATLFTTAGLSVTPANAAENTTRNYCQNIPESLVKQGFVPGICK
jgi:hypothetical protein